MSTKEIKARLKAAKAAVGRKDFQEVERICQEVFLLDDSNYTAHVFAGLAASELANRQEAREHYKTAIALQPEEQLAWKGLADFYDKCGTGSGEEQLDAIAAYQKLMTFVEGDETKKRSTLQKLVTLHKGLGNCAEVVSCCSRLLATYDASNQSDAKTLAELWLDITSYLLAEKSLSEDAWEMLDRGFTAVVESPTISEDAIMDLRLKYIQHSFDRHLHQVSREGRLEERIWGDCRTVLSQEPDSQSVLLVLSRLTLLDVTIALSMAKDLSLLEERRSWLITFYQHHRSTDDGGELGGIPSLAEAVVCVASGRWKEAKDAVEKGSTEFHVHIVGVTCSPKLCEGWLLSSFVHLRLHDNKGAEQQALKGLKTLRNAPVFAASDFERKLKLCLAQAYLGMRESVFVEQSLEVLTELAQEASHDCHVTAYLVKAYLLQGNTARAEEVLEELQTSAAADSAILFGLQGEVYLAKKEYVKAVEMFSCALEQQSTAEYTFGKGRALWEMPGSDKKQAYSSFLQAAKADPFHSDIFLYLGHYQKLITKDLKRAVKCYQKAVELQPSHTEAAICLGDVLFAAGDEEEAFSAYKRVTEAAPASKNKQVWLRMGLYQRKNGLHSDAIKSFQNALTADSTDKHCWECLGEAYLARGSHNSALKTFTKCVELDPSSLYCLYQIASIKQLLGLLAEAVTEYAAVLCVEPSYLPALKGRGESNLLLARLALRENFDGRAVDYASAALKDLTTAARLRPQFTCLWKLIGDCCTCLYDVAPEVARPTIPTLLKGQAEAASPEECEVIEKDHLILIGCRAYARALQLSPDASNLWHDLAVAYYYLGQVTREEGDKKKHLITALNAIKKAVSLSPQDHTHWNVLGIISAQSEVSNPALAQHAFVRSVQEEPNNVIAWANLGTLYLNHGNMELSHKAFRNAQSLDPSYVQAWVGQALIAENIGHSDSMDLFRHTTELAYHPEGSRGYGYWVCHTLGTLDPKLILNPGGVDLNPVALTGVLQARDCLQKCVERQRREACILNLLGLLFEQEGLLRQAEKAFAGALQALKLSTVDENDPNLLAVKVNHARVNNAMGRASEALAALSSFPQLPDLTTQLELPLALYRDCQLDKSIQAYEQVLSTVSEENKSAILSAIAMVAFAQKDYNKCKTMLFKAFQTSPPSPHGLVSLSVLGCLFNDLTLVQAALQEIVKIIEWQADELFLLHPSCVETLKTMEFMLLSKEGASECVETLTSVLKELPGHGHPALSPLTLHLLRDSSPSEALLCIQKLIHSNPTDVWALASLVYFLEQSSMPELKSRYHLVLQHQVGVEVAILPQTGVKSRWNQIQQETLITLEKWAKDQDS